MFYLVDVKERIGVEAQKIRENIRESIEESIDATHSREENGIFLGVTEIKKVGESGDILPAEVHPRSGVFSGGTGPGLWEDVRCV